MKDNFYIFNCPYCKTKNIYWDIKLFQLTISGSYDSIKCKNCFKYFTLSPKNFSSSSKIIDEGQKMKLQKVEIGGQYLKPEDIGNEKAIKATIEITGEGRVTTADFGNGEVKRYEIPIKVNEIEKAFSLSPTNQNALIDLLGDQTTDWIGKTFEVTLETCNVSKSGLQITVL